VINDLRRTQHEAILVGYHLDLEVSQSSFMLVQHSLDSGRHFEAGP
jgi:hypothetical protein